MRESTTQTNRVELYWSMSGEIACVEHIPQRDSDTWIRDAWTRMPDEVPWYEARCEFCDELCDACGVTLVDGECPKCHVIHGEPCPACGHRGYHQDVCAASDSARSCASCGGSGKRSTARSANGRELERHAQRGTPCGACAGTGVAQVDNAEVAHSADDAIFNDENGVSDADVGL